jgi:hypothetical protein
MGRRRTAIVTVVATIGLAITGCGSQTAPAASPSQTTGQPNGTQPSPSAPDGSAPPAVASSSAATSEATSDDGIVTESRRSSFGIVNQQTGDYVAGVGRRVVVLEIGIHGIGQIRTEGRALLRRTATGTIVHYDGQGSLDATARLDKNTVFGADRPADPKPARLRVEARMTPNGLGTADVWIDGRHHRVVATEPPHTAGPVTAVVVDDFRRNDWSDLFDHVVRLPGMTREHFVRAFGRGGTLSELTVTGATVYRIENGTAYADTPAHLVATIKGRHLDRNVAVQLVYRRGEWVFSSLARNVDGN